MENKHWILQLPIFKVISITILIIHVLGVPLFYSFIEYPEFFNQTDFLKLIFLTTSVGAICAIVLIVIGAVIFISSDSSKEEKQDSEVALKVILSLVISSMCLADFVLVMTYLVSQQVLLSKVYYLISLIPLTVMLLYFIVVGDSKKR